MPPARCGTPRGRDRAGASARRPRREARRPVPPAARSPRAVTPDPDPVADPRGSPRVRAGAARAGAEARPAPGGWRPRSRQGPRGRAAGRDRAPASRPRPGGRPRRSHGRGCHGPRARFAHAPRPPPGPRFARARARAGRSGPPGGAAYRRPARTARPATHGAPRNSAIDATSCGESDVATARLAIDKKPTPAPATAHLKSA